MTKTVSTSSEEKVSKKDSKKKSVSKEVSKGNQKDKSSKKVNPKKIAANENTLKSSTLKKTLVTEDVLTKEILKISKEFPSKIVKAPKNVAAKKNMSVASKDRTSKVSKNGYLLAEIELLGGSKDDLELLKDVLSDSEQSGNEGKNHEDEGDIMQDLKNFMQTLNLPTQNREELEEKSPINTKMVKEKVRTEPDILNDSNEIVLTEAKNLEAKPLPVKQKQSKEPKILKDKKNIESKIVNGSQSKGLEGKPTKQKLSKDFSNLKSRIEAQNFDPNYKKLVITPTSHWDSIIVANIPPLENHVSAEEESLIALQYTRAKALHNNECEIFLSKKFMKGSDKAFITTVLRNGTTQDKISALTMLIQESPVHALSYLKDHLMNGIIRKKSKRDVVNAVESLKDLYLVLLPDRKLKYFRDQNVLHEDVKPIHLILWYFEDEFKKLYFDFLKVIEELSVDTLTHVKGKSLGIITSLLSNKPEQEASLLSLLVNKLGDSDRKVAFQTCHLITSVLLAEHPVMTMVVVKEIERFLLRNGCPLKTLYVGLVALSSLVLRGEESEAAAYLIQVFFGFFGKMVKSLSSNPLPKKFKKPMKPQKPSFKKLTAEDVIDKNAPIVVDGINAKILSVILTGVNRAFPYAKLDDSVFDEHMDTLFKISHLGSFSICIQALTLIYQNISDRYYRTLYETLLDPRLLENARHPMYLNLLHKSLKNDSSVPRVKSFIKRLCQVCTFSVPFTCASLYLISEMMKIHPGLWPLIRLAQDDPDAYDGAKRDPLYTNADQSNLWEVAILRNHFHPTVKLYAETLSTGNCITVPNTTNYDPLQNHTLARFLDRFVFKNPKTVKSAYKGVSLMQARPPGLWNSDRFVAAGKKRSVIVKGDDGTLLMDDGVIKGGSNVPADEMFYQGYFDDWRVKKRKLNSVTKTVKQEDSDGEEEDEIADAIDKSLNGTADIAEVDDDDFDMEAAMLEGENALVHSDSEDEDIPLDQDASVSDDVSIGDDIMFDEEGSDRDSMDTEINVPSEENVSDSQKKSVPRSKTKAKKIERLSRTAMKLGYKGTYFTDANEDSFADFDDFQSLIDSTTAEDRDFDSTIAIASKPKRVRKNK